MTPKAIVFDLFHTLTGFESEWSDLPFTCDVLGIERRRWNEVITSGSRWRLAGEERDAYRILSRLTHEIDPRIADETIRRAAEIRSRRFRDALQRIPPANVETLKQLRRAGFGLGLVSNADATEVETWKDCPLSGLFDAEVFSCEVGHVKPEPEIFRKCIDALGRKPRECLFAGDGGSNELIGAKEVGMSTVFVSGVIAELWPERVAERIPTADHHVAWVPEILGLLGLANAHD
jgi:putative hydrolase of the HAD superfamily